MTRYFCTYFDHLYLPRGLALHDSLRRHCPDSELWVLCLSDVCYEVLKRLHLPGLHPFSLAEIEKEDAALPAAKQNRSWIEYIFTLTPSLCLDILEKRRPEASHVTYLDSDMFFFADPAPVFLETGDRSIAIVPHRFPPALRHLENRGIHNVGWVYFRRDEHGLACLSWWRERCLEWCRDIVEPDRFADQKYLDRFPKLFQNVAELQHKGVNAAPYNLGNYTVHKRHGNILLDETPLVLYHFHGFRRVNRFLYDPNLSLYLAKADGIVRRGIYAPYIAALRYAERRLHGLVDVPTAFSRFHAIPRAPEPKLDPLRHAVNQWRLFKREVLMTIKGEFIFQCGPWTW